MLFLPPFSFKAIFGVELRLNLLITDKLFRPPIIPPIIPNSSIPLVKFVENFNNAMMVRENADYRTRFSKSGAKLVVEKSEDFLSKARDFTPSFK